jgi:hypothetical protein
MNKVLETTKVVIKSPSFVFINQEKISNYARGFDHSQVRHWLSAAPLDFGSFGPVERIKFLIILNSLSFSYWGNPKWTVQYDDKEMDGAMAMVLALRRALDERVPLFDLNFCANATANDLSNILRANTEIPLLDARWKILREVGSNILARFDGNPMKILSEAKNDALDLVDLIVGCFPSFSDKSVYQEHEVWFSKRAQLLVADIHQMVGLNGFGGLKNADCLTACADYKIPMILRKLGILEYASDLARRIDGRIEIEHGSPEEIEIRASTIWAIEMIKEIVKRNRPMITSFEINDHLWLATQEKFIDDKPYHRTRTMAY